MVLIVGGVLLALFALSDAACEFSGGNLVSSSSLLLDSDVDFRLQWEIDEVNQTVTLGLSANDSVSWLGFGLGEETTGSMPGADIVTVNFANEPFVEDRFVPFTSFPYANNDPLNSDKSTGTFTYRPKSGSPIDIDITSSLFPVVDSSALGCADWRFVMRDESGGCKRAILQRDWSTGDLNDRNMTPGTLQPALWAWGTEQQVSYHGENRGLFGVDFGNAPDSQIDPSSIPCSGPSCGTISLSMGNYAIPAQTTTYACRGFDLRDFIVDNRHAIAFEPVIDNAARVHHILVHACNRGNPDYIDAHDVTKLCGILPGSEGNSPLSSDCESLLYAWAPGAGNLILPPEAGMPVGETSFGTRYVVIEIHYDNPEQLSGEVDDTAINIYATTALRPHDASVLNAGDPITAMESLPEGVSAVHRQGVCESVCTEAAMPNPDDEITLFGVFNHQHSHGKKMWTNHFSKTGDFKRTIAPVEFWNFGVQKTNQINVTFKSGDELFVHCRYDTSRWPIDVEFGIDSLEEMCMAFFYYFPAKTVNSVPFSSCGGLSSFTSFSNSVAFSELGPPSLVKAVLPEPKQERMYLSWCGVPDESLFFGGNSETVNYLGIDFDINPQKPDPMVYDAATNTWNEPTIFGSGAGPEAICEPTLPPSPTVGNSDDPNYDFQTSPLSGTQLYWRILPDCKVSLRIESSKDGWIGFGLGTEMVGSKVVIAQGSSTIGEFALDSRSLMGITPGNAQTGIFQSSWNLENGKRNLRLNLTSIDGNVFNTGCVSGARRRVLQSDTTDDIVVAFGDSTTLNYHGSSKRSFKVDWANGGSFDAANWKIQAHAYLMSIVFGILVPIQILFPIAKSPDEKWFQLHRASAILSLLLFIVAVSLAFVFVENHFTIAHHFLGIAVLVLFLSNPIVAFIRPEKDAPNRIKWLRLHRALGYGALGLAFVNMLLGADLVVNDPAYFSENSIILAIVFIVLGFVVLVSAFAIKNVSNSSSSKNNVAVVDP